MPKKTEEKKTLVEKYQNHKDDTGSIEVQIALLSQRVVELSKHLEGHKKDGDSRRGLLIMVGKRRRLLNYIKKSEPKSYEKLIKELGLRK
jgi:small subunit ribosomal protein S15